MKKHIIIPLALAFTVLCLAGCERAEDRNQAQASSVDSAMTNQTSSRTEHMQTDSADSALANQTSSRTEHAQTGSVDSILANQARSRAEQIIINNSSSNKNVNSQIVMINTPEEFYNGGKRIRSSREAGNEEIIVARLNQKNITQFQIDEFKIYRETNFKKPLTEKEAFNEFNKLEVLYQKAETMFKIPTSEVNSEAIKARDLMLLNKDTKKCLSEMCRGLGIDEKEYVEYIKPEIKNQLLYQRLYRYLHSEYNKNSHNTSLESYVDNYCDNLYKTAKIEILKESLK